MSMERSESHLDLESQNHALVKADSTSPGHRWRFVFVIFSIRQAFISSTTGEKRLLVTDVASLSSTPSSRLISSTSKSNTGDDDRDVELATRSSTEVIATESVQPHGVDHESNKERQKAEIAKIVKERDLKSLREFGGVWRFAEALDTDLKNGLPCRSASAQPHGSEIQAPVQGFFHILLYSCNKCMICLLMLCAILSMAFGIQEEGVNTGWYEGVFMVNAIIVLVVVSAIREYWYIWRPSGRKELSRIGEIEVHVFRGGRELPISMTNVVLGDIIILKVGDLIPADGLLLPGASLVLDEYSTIDDQNPFMFYGSTVTNGNGRMLATSVGKDTVWSEMMSNVNVTKVPKKLETSLQFQLDRLNTWMQIIGLAIAVIILAIQFIRFKFDKASERSGSPDPKGKPAAIRDFVDAILRLVMKPRGKARILVISLTVFLAGITEGLPLMVTLAIHYWNKKALSGKGKPQDFLACVTTSSVTTICTDKNCGLTLHQMEVEIFRVGDEFIRDKSDVAQTVLEHLCHGIFTDSLRSQTPCSLTIEEDPLLRWAAELDIDSLKQECTIVAEEKLDFDEAPRCGVLLRKGQNGETTESHWKGPAPKILERCSHYYNSKGKINAIDKKKRTALKKDIKDMQDRRLKTVAFGYKPNVPRLEEEGLILLGLVGLKHCSCKREIEACIGAGINIKLVSGCNVSELESVANHCGLNILTSDSVVVGENFRNSTDEERMEMVDRICVMGNSLPSDKLLLVKSLKQKGHRVAMVGCRTDETPAIKEADVGIAVGKCSTEMARESSNIILSDGDFNFLDTNIILCGRCAYENIQKFLQLELTMNISWPLTSITAMACFGDTPMTAIQFIWICAVVTVLGGLALLTEPPTEQLMKKSPVRPVDSPITRTMWRNIVPQALYQATVLVMLQFKGQVVLGISQKVSETMVFNSFVLSQVFNWFSARDLEKKNVFKGIHQNCWFVMAVVAALVLQEVYTEIAHSVSGSPNLNCQEWAYCFLIGMVSWPIDLATKLMSGFIAGRYGMAHGSNTGFVGMTNSASSESLVNLESPLINDGSQ